MPTRRDVLKASLAFPLSTVRRSSWLGGQGAQGPRVVVVGAGAFGGWTALELQRLGARVTLVDAWGPGHTRASSGGETRVIRTTYGTRVIYTRMAARALTLWREYEARWQRQFLTKTGALWMFGADDSFGRASASVLRAEGLAVEELTSADAARRYPQISFDGVRSVLFEADAGSLLARRSCEHVVAQFVAAGGDYRLASVVSPATVDRPLQSVPLDGGGRLDADAFVFACGPWLGHLFPDVIGARVTPTRQEVHYFGTLAGDDRFLESRFPVWVDYGDALIYGIPGNVNRGFKVANDAAGPVFDPTLGSREPSPVSVASARAFVARRFPLLKDAPYLGSEVCQYEASPDSHFIVDTHPRAANTWIVGGGSGHGFKMGPAMGELVAAQVLGQRAKEPTFSLSRFKENRS